MVTYDQPMVAMRKRLLAYVWPLSEKHLLDVGKTWDYRHG